jgi:PEP-CTERM motif
MKAIVPSLLAVAVPLHFTAPARGATVTKDASVFYGTPMAPLAVVFPDRELIFPSHLLSSDLAVPIRDNGGPYTGTDFVGFPPASTFGQQLVDDFVGQSNQQLLLNEGFIGDPLDALLAAFAVNEADLEIATGLQFDAIITPFEYQGIVSTDFDGGLVTDPPPPSPGFEGTSVPFPITGTVDTDIWRMDATFQLVPEPASWLLLAAGGVILLLAARHRRATAAARA